MTRFAIGDIQGCHTELMALLDKLDFDPARDQVWFTGDLVNRGPRSLETLRTLRELGPAAVTVLGNHDLHLLAVARGISRIKHRDTFTDVLNAPDCEELLDWLRHRPLLHHADGFYLIHAGLPPQWTPEEAVGLAREAEEALQSRDYTEFLWHMYGDQPTLWSPALTGWERLRFITNCLTRLRFCAPDGQVDFKQKGRPGSQPYPLVPWFDVADRKSQAARIVFGHWSTLGFSARHNAYCLDTGCLWGGELTALRLDDSLKTTTVKNLKGAYQRPSKS